jgi:alkanesulfonate monooxygenase SsuD/methylene tetrahydromethanopterin reductase-like flavin-dependent oxidoreductase (luciferase family)
MAEQRISMIERIVHRIEEHLEEWRRRDAALQAEADEARDKLWAAAAERERLLVKTINEEESRRDSLQEITREHRVVFVAHSEEVAKTLEEFAEEGDRPLRVIPGKQGSYAKEAGVKGSWLVFEEASD